MRSFSPFGRRGGPGGYSPGQLLLLLAIVLIAVIDFQEATGGGGGPLGLANAATRLAVLLPALILSLSFHELAHAYVATYLGDDTAKRQGRLTLDPRAHLDPMGTFLLIFTIIFGFGIGWARPVPVNPWRLSIGPRAGMALVGVAGPIANLVLAFVGIKIFDFAPSLPPLAAEILVQFVRTNVWLAVFNMIPVPPLDGSRVLMGILPGPMANGFARLEPYGPMILLFIVFFGQSFLRFLIVVVSNPILRAMGA